MRGLRERGVLVRGGGALGASTPALRVTYGLPEENARFLDALAEVLALGARRAAPLYVAPRRLLQTYETAMIATVRTSGCTPPAHASRLSSCAYLAWRFI